MKCLIKASILVTISCSCSCSLGAARLFLLLISGRPSFRLALGRRTETLCFLWVDRLPTCDHAIPTIVERCRTRVPFRASSRPFSLSPILQHHLKTCKTTHPNVVVFCRAVTQAAHLELTSDVMVQAFIHSFHGFASTHVIP